MEPTTDTHDQGLQPTLGRADCKEDGNIYRNDESWIPSKNSTCRTCSCKVCIFFTLIHECAFNYFPTWLGFLTIFFRLHLINQFYDFCCSTDNELYDFEVFDYQVDLCRSFTKTTFNFNFKIFFSSEW